MYRYSEGALYHPEKTTWPETPQYMFRQGGHELLLFYANVNNAERVATKSGRVELALVVDEPVILFMFRFGALDWGDASFSWNLVPEEWRTYPTEESVTMLLTILLVEATNGIIQVARPIPMSQDFTSALNRAIRQQVDRPYVQSEFDAHLNHLYTHNPDPNQLVAQAVATMRLEAAS